MVPSELDLALLTVAFLVVRLVAFPLERLVVEVLLDL
jgi:hypothetical protein